MTKSKMKKIVSSALVANLMLGSVITALPTQGAAVENAATGNSAEKRLVSNLKATEPILKNGSFAVDTGVPKLTGWSFGVMKNGTTQYNIPLTVGNGGWYRIGDDKFNIKPAVGGIDVYSMTVQDNLIYQVIKTKPGETYTFSYNARLNGTGGSVNLLYSGINVIDNKSNASIVSKPHQGVSGNTSYTNVYTSTFIATGEETRVEIVNAVTNDYQSLFVSNAQVTSTDTTAPAKPVIAAMTDRTATISGTAEAYSTVKLYANGSYITEVRVGSNGQYSTAAGPYVAGTKISATATDTAGNISDASEI
ncbi:hypothetical protein HCB26_16870, partial [Listeria booriae]